MKHFLILALCLLATGAAFGQKNKGKGNTAANSSVQPQKRWGIAWEVPKGWTRASAGEETVKFQHQKDEDVYVLVRAVPKPADEAARQALLAEFANKENDVQSYEDFEKDSKATTHNGWQVRLYEVDEEPDLEDAEDPEDYEGYWTKIVVFEQGDKLILVSMSEIYTRKRKHAKTFDDIYRSFKRG